VLYAALKSCSLKWPETFDFSRFAVLFSWQSAQNKSNPVASLLRCLWARCCRI